MTAIIFKIQIINNYLDNDFHSKYCSEDIIKVSQHLQTPKEIKNTKEKGGTNILDKPCLTSILKENGFMLQVLAQISPQTQELGNQLLSRPLEMSSPA